MDVFGIRGNQWRLVFQLFCFGFPTSGRGEKFIHRETDIRRLPLAGEVESRCTFHFPFRMFNLWTLDSRLFRQLISAIFAQMRDMIRLRDI